jgi:uncharacterized protein (DUF849 family)
MPKPNLMVAPNGARKQKTDHPMVPVTIPEIARTAYDCFRAGADSLHLHIRTRDGAHSLDPVLYKEASHTVQKMVPNMGIQITTESAGIFGVAEQFHCLKSVKPKSASISIREITRDLYLAPQVYGFCAEADVTVQHILYDTKDIVLLYDWMNKGWIKPHMNAVLFVMGRYQPMVLARPTDLNPFLKAAQDMQLNWTVCAFGQHELACAKAALHKGGNIRIGFENNIQLPDGSAAKDNAQTVALAAALIKDMTHD